MRRFIIMFHFALSIVLRNGCVARCALNANKFPQQRHEKYSCYTVPSGSDCFVNDWNCSRIFDFQQMSCKCNISKLENIPSKGDRPPSFGLSLFSSPTLSSCTTFPCLALFVSFRCLPALANSDNFSFCGLHHPSSLQSVHATTQHNDLEFVSCWQFCINMKAFFFIK